MKLSRAYHTATKLLNGDVLVCGGVPQERHGNESVRPFASSYSYERSLTVFCADHVVRDTVVLKSTMVRDLWKLLK